MYIYVYIFFLPSPWDTEQGNKKQDSLAPQEKTFSYTFIFPWLESYFCKMCFFTSYWFPLSSLPSHKDVFTLYTLLNINGELT